ncbi:MAG: carbohydrate kinase [Gemmataceae bacterium]|nr:carbohydrate kinase [Gemmataceae bacterium]
MADGSGAIVGLGEILWDLFPGGKQLGGAPFNFTFHCHQLGHESYMVSRIGDDQLGREIRDAVGPLGLNSMYLQSDDQHPTGTVRVEVDAQGQPSYTITPKVAYDYLGWDDRLHILFSQASAVCFGTLIQRSALARQTVQHALRAAQASLIVYDINLRQSFYNREIIEESMRASRWLKLNDVELKRLHEMLGLKRQGDAGALAQLRKRYGLELVCLTRGAHGCLIQTADEEIAVPGLPVVVADTVGAGDAFTAGLVVYTLEGRTLDDAAVFANRLAAQVASLVGGTPTIDRRTLEGHCANGLLPDQPR